MTTRLLVLIPAARSARFRCLRGSQGVTSYLWRIEEVTDCDGLWPRFAAWDSRSSFVHSTLFRFDVTELRLRISAFFVLSFIMGVTTSFNKKGVCTESFGVLESFSSIRRKKGVELSEARLLKCQRSCLNMYSL
jgi:hypothetical protein